MTSKSILEKHINESRPLAFQDLDWELAARCGLTQSEKIILQYVADVEGQTIYYMGEMLSTRLAHDSEALTFMTIWNYEEYFHGHALNKLLTACGHALAPERREQVRMSAHFAAKAEALVQWILGRIMPRTFKALYLAWASSQEFLTRLAYERLASTTSNPTLKELCLRIAKQERRHFAWYFNAAREELGRSKKSQGVIRFLFARFWTPVGVGVKSKADARQLVDCLFPGKLLYTEMARVDAKIGQLPGMEGLAFAESYSRDLRKDRAAGRSPRLERREQSLPNL